MPPTQCRLGRGLPPYYVASWSIQPFGHNRYGPKIGGCVPLGARELGPYLTQCGQPGAGPTCMRFSYILITLDGFLCYTIEYFIHVVQPESGIISPDLQVVIDHAIPRLRRMCWRTSTAVCISVYVFTIRRRQIHKLAKLDTLYVNLWSRPH